MIHQHQKDGYCQFQRSESSGRTAVGEAFRSHPQHPSSLHSLSGKDAVLDKDFSPLRDRIKS